MCAVMWRDFHEQPHWLDTDMSDLDMMARPLQTWSWEEDEAKRRTQHQAEDHSGKFRQGEDQSIPEGNIITNDVKGSRFAEVSFQPSSIGEKAIKVHDVSFQSIMKCDVDICQGVERGHRVSRWHHVPRGRHVRDDGVD